MSVSNWIHARSQAWGIFKHSTRLKVLEIHVINRSNLNFPICAWSPIIKVWQTQPVFQEWQRRGLMKHNSTCKRHTFSSCMCPLSYLHMEDADTERYIPPCSHFQLAALVWNILSSVIQQGAVLCCSTHTNTHRGLCESFKGRSSTVILKQSS